MFYKIQKRSFTFMFVASTLLQTSIIFSAHMVIPVNSATALEEIDENPAHPGKCYVKETGVAHVLGSTWQAPELLCAQATCYRSGSESKFLIAYQTCGLVSSNPDCEVVEDLTLPYPSCCPRIRCNPRSALKITNFDMLDSRPKKIDNERNEIQKSRPGTVSPQTYPVSAELSDFPNQEKQADLLEKRPSKLLDIPDYPNNNFRDYTYPLQTTGQILFPLLVTIP